MAKDSKRKFDLDNRKKISQKIKNIDDKNILIDIFKIVNRDIGNKFSHNKSGIFFNINLLSDNAVQEIKNIVKPYQDTESESIVEQNKISYQKYTEPDELEIYNSFGYRLSNQEKNILKQVKKQ